MNNKLIVCPSKPDLSFSSWIEENREDCKSVYLMIKSSKELNLLNKCDINKFEKFCYKYSWKHKTNY